MTSSTNSTEAKIHKVHKVFDITRLDSKYDLEAAEDRTPLLETKEEIDKLLALAATLDLKDCIRISDRDREEIKRVAEDLLSGKITAKGMFVDTRNRRRRF